MATITKYYKDDANNGESDSTVTTELANTGFEGPQIVAVRSGKVYVKFCIDGIHPSGLKALQFYNNQKAIPENTIVEITQTEFQTATGL